MSSRPLTTLLQPGFAEPLASAGVLLLRVLLGGLTFWHGMEKLLAFGTAAGTFRSLPLLGSTGTFTLIMLIELLGGLAVLLGFATRLAALPVAFSYALAFMLAGHWASREFALAYLAGFGALVGLGGGKWSVDSWRTGGPR